MKKKVSGILLVIVIVLQIIYTTYTFMYVKKGAHSDEIWSYGLANAYYGYGISYDYGNREKWIPGKVMWDYITVQEGEQFSYDSVYANSTQDMHPFLYDMVLHTVCSFFPETFSWWFGFSMNLFFLAFTQIFLFLTTRKITKANVTALITCIFYGAGKGALLNFTLIRPYAMLTMLCMGFVYFSTCCYEDLEQENKISLKHMVPAAVMANLSFMTHYYGIAFIGIFTALFCVYLFIRKKWKQMFGYGASMTLALGIALLMFPRAVSSVQDYGTGGGMLGGKTAFSPAVQIRILLCYLFEYNYGFKIGWYPTAFWNIVLPLAGAAIVGAAMLSFPFRHDERFWAFLKKIKNHGMALGRYLKNANYIPVFVVGSCFVLFEVIAYSVEVYLMGSHVMRYISIMVPLVAMIVVIAIRMLLLKILKREVIAQIVVGALALIALFRVHMTTDYPYSYLQFGKPMDILAETTDRNVLVVGKNTGSFSTEFAFFTSYLYKADSVCFTAYSTIADFVEYGRYEPKKIDYAFINMDIFQLSDEGIRQLQMQVNGNIVTESDNMLDEEGKMVVQSNGMQVEYKGEYNYNCEEQIREMTGGAPYQVLGILSGQRGSYYILRFL